MLPSFWIAVAFADAVVWPRPRSAWRALLVNLRRR